MLISSRRRHRSALALAVAGAALVAPSLAAAQEPVVGPISPAKSEYIKTLATQAYVYGLSWFEMYKNRYGAIHMALPGYPQTPQNRLFWVEKLMTPETAFSPLANSDTLYGAAFLNLANEPVLVTVPPTGNRYFSLQFFDMSMETAGYIGTRVTGDRGGTYLIAGPNFRSQAPAGIDGVIRSSTSWVTCIGRVLVDGERDVPEAIKIQKAVKLRTLAEDQGKTAVPLPTETPVDPRALGTDKLVFFRVLNQMWQHNPPPIADQSMLKQFASIGIGPGLDLPTDPKIREAMVEAVTVGEALMKSEMAPAPVTVNGWDKVDLRIGVYGDDWLFRAVTAVRAIQANVPQEAVYISAYLDGQDQTLDGNNAYVLRFEKDEIPPVDAFWSLSVYKASDNLQYQNEIRRYAIGDRTPGLKYGPDGSLTLYIQHTRPSGDRVSNWLPVPKDKFTVTLRAYIPRTSILSGDYQLPGIQRAK